MDQDETWHARRPRPWPYCVRWGSSFPSLKAACTCSHLPIFGPYLLWPNGWMDSDALGSGNFVLDGDPAPVPKMGWSPNYRPCLWEKGWMDQDGTWHGGGPRSRPHCARWGPSSPPPKRDRAQFSDHVYCGQTAVRIRIRRLASA